MANDIYKRVLEKYPETTHKCITGIKMTISASTTLYLGAKGLLTIHCPIDEAVSFMSHINSFPNVCEVTINSNESFRTMTDNGELYEKYAKLVNNTAQRTELLKLDLSSVNLKEIPNGLKKLSKLKYLNLDNTDISSIPSWISELVSLEELYAGNIHLHHIPKEVCDLVNLKVLSLKKSRIDSLPDRIGQLRNLQELYVRGFQLTELPDSIGDLYSLKKLVIDCNGLQRIPASINRLTNLRELGIYRASNIKWPKDMKGLKNLMSLSIYGRNIDTLPSSISHLKSLTVIDLTNCGFTSFPAVFEKLGRIERIILKGNNITSIPSWIGDVKTLKYLDLSRNNISSLPDEIGNLPLLRYLNLSNLILDELPKSLLSLNLNYITNQKNKMGSKDLGIIIEDLQLKKQPVSLFYYPRKLIEDYYNQQQIDVNESKIIFLGSEGVGKTHTIKRILNDNKRIRGTQKETPGIGIDAKKYSIGNLTYCINFWDFGGQEIMHSMHRCFLTERTGYVVVVSTRYGDVTAQARFWLRNLRSFAKDAPVIVFVNIWNDGTYYGIDESSLRHQFNNIIGIVQCSAKDSNDNDFSAITKAIQVLALKNDSIGMHFPETWENIRQSIIARGEKNDCINSEAYIEICNQNNVRDASIQGWLLDWFNDLGECFTYSYGESFVSETQYSMILNPKWLTNAVYIIIRELGEDSEGGIVSHKKIKSILHRSNKGTVKDISYSSEECEYVLEVMRKHMLSYKIPSREEEFIPGLLHNKKGRLINDEWSDSCRYELKYDYLPENVLHNLMVEYYRLIDRDLCWRNQFIINITGMHGVETAAVISADYDSCTLFIQIKNYSGKKVHDIFRSLRDKIFEINQKLNLNSQDFIVVDSKDENDELERISVRRLLKLLERGIRFYEAYEKRYEIGQLLGGAFSEDVVNEIMAHKDNDDPIQPIIVTFGKRKAKDYLQKRIIEMLSVDDIYEYVISACKQIQTRKKFWNIPPVQIVSEDDRNDEMRDLISSRGVFVRDQTRTGQGSGGNNPGEVDLMVMKSATDAMTIIEAMNTTGVITRDIKRHLDKLIKGYNKSGLRDLFLVSYVEIDTNKFASFWKRYKNRVKELSTGNFTVNTDIAPEENESLAWIKSIKITYDYAGEDIRVYHICARVAE